MNLQTLQSLKLQAVSRMLAIAEPMMVESQQLKDSQGKPRQVWVKRDNNGHSQPLTFEDSPLTPVHAITHEGVIQNCYGNAVLRTWDRLSIEDVLRMSEVVQQEAAQKAEAAVQAGEAWQVELFHVLDRMHTMARVCATQRGADGAASKVSFLVRAQRGVSDLLPRLKAWTPGNVQTYLSQLVAQGHEVALTPASA